MPNILTDAQFVRLLDERLTEVMENAYDDLPSMIPMLFDVMGSDSAWDEYFEIGAVPDIVPFNGKLTYLNVSPGYHTKIEPKEYAAGLQFQRKLIDDKKYGVMEADAAGLMQAAQRVREKQGARLLQYAFSSAFDYMVREENLSLCNSSHTTKAGTSTSSGFDNSGTSAFSKTAVAATRILMRQFRNDISERIDMSDNFELWVPDNLADDALELVGTEFGYDTAAGDKNAQYGRYRVVPYLRLDDVDSNNWFMINADLRKKHFKFIDRVAPEPNNTIDFQTFAFLVSVYMRIAYGFIDWRSTYGHVVS